MSIENELLQELKAMAELNRSRAPQTEGPHATQLDCLKCNFGGCQTLQTVE